ncbi:MAG: hypothetical protein ABIK85_10155 [Candidatus Eisenbacteria bacterium]
MKGVGSAEGAEDVLLHHSGLHVGGLKAVEEGDGVDFETSE